MRLAHLVIKTTDAAIGMRSQQLPMQIRQRPADLQINQQHADLIQISHRASKLYIDQTAAFADANLKTPLRMANDFWAKSEQAVNEHIAKKRQQGDQMMKIENGFGAFAHIAKTDSEKPMRKAVIAYMPSSAFQVKFDYDPGELSFSVPDYHTDIRVTRNEPEIQIPKWQIDTYLRQKESISFQAVGALVNRGL